MDYDKIEINTTQNVLVSYEPAGIFERMLAYILDSVFVGVYIVLIIWIIALTVGFGNPFSGYSAVGIVMFVLLYIPALFYHLWTEQFLGGQSFGKKIMNIKVVKLDGTQPSFGAYFLRWLMRLLDFSTLTPVVGMIAVMATKNSQRLGDLTAGTTVIKMNPRASLHNTILYKAQSGYKISFPEVSKLSDRDVGIIKEVYTQCRASGDYASLEKLALKVLGQMGLKSVNMTAEQFINTVLADYSQFEFEA